jgi:hypothetical protein
MPISMPGDVGAATAGNNPGSRVCLVHVKQPLQSGGAARGLDRGCRPTKGEYQMRRLFKAGLVAGMVGMSALAAEPASAATVIAGINLSKSGPYSAPATCTGAVGVSTSLNSITYVIKAEATAVATNGAVGVGTSVQCRVVDASSGAVYGGASGGLPGPQVVAVGTATIPLSRTVKTVVCSGASFTDGGSFSSC